MGFIAKKSGNNLPLLEEGIHKAVCQSVIDIGLQFNEKFQKLTHQLIIIWELPEQRISVVNKEGKVQDLPRVTSKKYTCSLHEKSALAKDLQSWRGKRFTPAEEEGFDLSSLLNENCMLQILHTSTDGKTYANISTILPLFKGMEKVEPENPVRYFSFADHRGEIPSDIPDWIVKLIKSSEEWSRLNSSDDVGDASFIVDEVENR